MRRPRSARVRIITAVASGVLTVPLLIAAPATAEPEWSSLEEARGTRTSFVVRAQAPHSPPSGDELKDIAAVKAQVPGATGLESSLDWQTEFTVAVTQLQEEFSDDFADAGIDRSNNTAWVSFAGAAPDGIREILSTVPVDVEVRQGTGWTEIGLTEYGQALHYAVLGEEGVVDAATDIDTSTGSVAVTVEGAPGLAPATVEARLERLLPELARVARTEAAGKVRPRGSSADVDAAAAAATTTVEAVSELGGGTETVSGGGSLSSCTAGFSVSSGRYAHGIITAEHCGNSQKYFNRSVLTWRASHAGGSGDVEFHSSTESSDARFYYKSGATRAITATANPVTGMSICKYGKTTLNTCDEVYKLNQCRGSYCGLAMTHRHRTDGGDSGGPWFWGNTGYGVHSGFKTYLAIERAMFTPIRAGASVLGVTVKLS